MPSRVSVVIPAYNAEQTLARAVDSVLRQSSPPHEVLVIDDGSTDGTVEVAELYGVPVRLIQKSNGGAASARNTGIDAAAGDVIAFLDADDYWEPHKLQSQCAVLAEHPCLGMVAGRYFQQEPDGEREASGAPPRIRTGQALRVRGVNALEFAMHAWTGVVAARRETIGDLRFVSGLEPAEDRDFWFQLALKGEVLFIDAPLATAVLEPNSLSRGNVARDCGNMLRVLNKNREELPGWAWAKWSSHTRYRWAACEPSVPKAWWQYALSLLTWPLPYRRCDVSMPLARLKLLARLLRQSLTGRPRRPSAQGVLA